MSGGGRQPGRLSSGPGRIARTLRSQGLALALFFAAAGLAVYGTTPAPLAVERLLREILEGTLLPAAGLLGLVDTFHSALLAGLLGLLCLNVAWCTAHRHRRRAAGSAPAGGTARRVAAWLDVAVHAAILLVLAGGAVKGWAGFVGTQIIPVGQSTETVYDWDRGRDVPLGFTVAVTAQEKDFYPHKVRIGVSRAETGERLQLLELAEGRPLRVPGEDLEITAGALDREAGSLAVRARSRGVESALALETQPGGRTTGEAGAYSLTLVAFRETIRTVRSRVSIREGGREVAQGWLRPNGRMSHAGTSLFQTAWGADERGNPYAGIQVSRDPGAPLFWTGCVLLGLALPVFLFLRHGR